jgi:hypothetical protein
VGGLGHDRRLPFIVSNLRDIVLAGFRHSGGPVRARLGFTLGAPALLLVLIHRSAWNRYSPKFAKGRSTPGSPTRLAEPWLWGLRADAPSSRFPLQVERSS